MQFTPMQKKVLLIGMVILGAFSLLVFTYMHLVKKSINQRSLGPKKDEEITDKQKLILPIEKTDLSIKISRPIHEKLKRNRQFAAEQQSQQTIRDNIDVENGKIPNKIASKDLHSDETEIDGLIVGIASCEGRRKEMEDSEIVGRGSFSSAGISYPFQLFGVFDGHGGKRASTFMKNEIVHALSEKLSLVNRDHLSDDGIFKALKETFKTLDSRYLEGSDGTTATIALILEKKIWVANVGDARTILVKADGIAIQASEDAKPTMERFKKKIEKLGGNVFMGRVNGILGVARAIGDKQFVSRQTGKKIISPNPKITSYPLEDFEEGYLILACDGLWDVMSTQDVGSAIKKMKEKNQLPLDMSQRLVYTAIEKYRSQDNVTAIVVKLL